MQLASVHFHNASDKNLFEDNDDTQIRSNHAIILNTHKEVLENISLIDIPNEFCRENDSWMNSFGTFSDSDIICQLSVKKVSAATQT